ncbi:MAG: tetratricopeptide (TPR) repeat protein [Candidatus Latescibacterota bacterium]|jgi:tetratricopeptide (TPR) repeat protein
MGLVFYHNAFLGGRDWDLLSFPGLFCALWGVRGLLRFPNKTRVRAALWMVVLPIVLLHTGAWIALNAHVERVHARTAILMQFSNQSTHYRYYATGYHYALREGKTQEAIYHFRRALEALPLENTLHALHKAKYEKWLGRVLVRDEQYDEARAVLERAFASQGGRSQYEQDMPFLNDLIFASLKLCVREIKERNLRRAEEYLKEIMAYCNRALEEREDAYVYLYLGYAMDMQDRPAEAAAAFYKSLKLQEERTTIIDTYSHLAHSLERMGELGLALSALEEGAVRVSSAELYEELAALYARAGEIEKARTARAAAAVRAAY